MAKGKRRKVRESESPRDPLELKVETAKWFLTHCWRVECPLAITDTAVPPVGRELTDFEAAARDHMIAVLVKATGDDTTTEGE